MKTRGWKTENGGWNTHSVLECGSPLPLFFRPPAESRLSKSARGLAQSKIWRRMATLLFCFFILHSSFCLRASGQSYSIDWHKIAGGGGASTNGQYTVSGTIGQPDAGNAMTGGNYSLTGGFWSLISVVQTGGAPTLNIRHSDNTVTIYWQDVSGWNLQTNSDLSAAANWSENHNATLLNGTNYLNVIPPTGSLFFRLAQ